MTENKIQEYSPTEAALAELKGRMKDVVYDVATTAGMEVARKDRRELVTLRTTLEAERKRIKAPALERCKAIDEEAKRITAEILSLELPIDKQIKAEEQRKEEERQAKLRAEQERVAGIQKRIDLIKNAPLVAVNKSADEIEIAIQKINALDIDKETYQEFEITAVETRVQVVATLQEMLNEKREVERIRAEQAAEQERLRKEAAEQAEKLRLEREQMEAEQREQEAALRKEKEEQERILAEQKAQMEAELAERRAQIEKENEEARARIAAERAEAEEEARRIAEETKRAEEAKAEAERVERERLDAEKAEAERQALAKKAERQAKRLEDPVEVIRLVNDAANNDAMSDSHKIAMIKGLVGTFLERHGKE